MMIYRNTKGLTFVEIIVSVAIISIIIMGGAQAIKYVMHAMVKDRQEIQANNFAQMIIDDLKAKCVPETFYDLGEDETTSDYEDGSPRKYPNLRGDVHVTSVSPDGRIEATITIKFLKNLKESKYYITLVKNTGLQPKGIISGRVVNYVTKKGIPDALVEAPSSKVDGTDISFTTKEDGSFTLTGVKVGTDISITISKLGSCPNDLDYDPGYYLDYDLIDESTMKYKEPEQYENTSRSNDSLYWTKSYVVQNNEVTQIGPGGIVYLCPMAIVRGWVREEDDDDTTGIERIVVGIYNSGNFNSNALTKTNRNNMHPYYDGGLTLSDNASSGHYYVTTRDGYYTNTYSVEGEDISFSLEKGEYVFFNVRPGAETYLRAHGRSGSNPTVQEGTPGFAWGYLRSTFEISGKLPYIIVKSYNFFNTPGSQYTGAYTMEPYINEQNDNHTLLPVTDTGYKYYQYGACTHTYHDFNVFARSSVYESKSASFCAAEDFSQQGWDNYESIAGNNPGEFPTCFVARRRGGITGRIVSWPDNNVGIGGITVLAKVWADTNTALSKTWTTQFRYNCVSVQTASDGYFYLYNIYGKEQQYYATGKPTSPLPNWDGHMEAFNKACEDDTSLQYYAVLRITDSNLNYMPRLIRARHTSVFDHTVNSYPAPSWTNGMTDFGDIAMVNISSGVTVTGRLLSGGAGVSGADVITKSIYGLDMDSTDNTILGMNPTNSIVATQTQADGSFILNNVMPNFILLRSNTISAVDNDKTDLQQNPPQPRGSMQKIRFFVPGLTLTNITLQGRVTDYMAGTSIVDAKVSASPPTTVIDYTDSSGYYYGNQNIGAPAGEWKSYYEHLPADSSDPYIVYVSWDGATRTIDLGDIDVGNQNNSKTITITARKTGYEYESEGGYFIINNSNITANFSLLKHYRIKYFGRVLDEAGNPIEAHRIYIRLRDSRHTWRGVWTTSYTNSNGYWGDWTPKDGSNKGGTEVELTLYPRARSWSNPGTPYWYIDIRAYNTTTWQYKKTYIRSEPKGWFNGSEIDWADGYAVHVATITIPLPTPPPEYEFGDGM